MTVLDEAAKIVGGDRAASYGPAERNLSRIAAMWAAYLDHPVAARDVAQMMVLLKVSRDAHSHKRDNLVDQAGYTLLADMLEPVVADVAVETGAISMSDGGVITAERMAELKEEMDQTVTRRPGRRLRGYL